MIFFILILILLAFILAVIKISFIEQYLYMLLNSVVIVLPCLFFYPFAVRMPEQYVLQLFSDPGFLGLVCLIIVVEALITMFLSVHLMNAHYRKQRALVIRSLAIFPNVVLHVCLGVMLVLAQNRIMGYSFLLVTILFLGGVLLVVLLASIIVRYFLSEWQSRLSLMLSLAFLLLVIGMFLPLLITDIRAPENNWHISVFNTFGLLAMILGGTSFGYYIYTIRRY